MPNVNLTEISVRALKGSDQYTTYFDTNLKGFGVRVGLRKKTFIVVRGRSRERITLGHYPELSLADARAKARKQLAGDPEPKAVRILFKDAFDEYLRDNFQKSTSGWPYVVKLIRGKHFQPLEHRRLGAIFDPHIEECIDNIEAPSSRLHGFRILRAFFNWCLKPPRRYLLNSPMQGYDAPVMEGKRSRILTDDELRKVWLAAEGGSRPIFRLLILWGTRSTETTRIERDWLRDGALTIPGFQDGKRMTKNGRSHAIPVLPLASEVLDGLYPGRFYFPGRFTSEVSITPSAMSELRYEIQAASGTKDWGAHDLRRTFRSNMARLGVPRHICELLLNHSPGALDEIYDRYTYLPEKRKALAKYEKFMLKLLCRGETRGSRVSSNGDPR